MSRLLITGGSGYTASHTAAVLSELGYRVVLYDNVPNSSPAVLENLGLIVGQRVPFVKGDVREAELFTSTLASHSIDAGIHSAGIKAVGEAVEKTVEF